MAEARIFRAPLDQATRGNRFVAGEEAEVYPPSQSELRGGPGMGRRQGSGSDRPGLGAVPCLWLATQGTPQVLCTSHQRPSPRDLGLTCTTLHHVLVNDVLVSGYRYFDRYLRLSMSPLNGRSTPTTAIFNSLMTSFLLTLFAFSIENLPITSSFPSLHDVVE